MEELSAIDAPKNARSRLVLVESVFNRVAAFPAILRQRKLFLAVITQFDGRQRETGPALTAPALFRKHVGHKPPLIFLFYVEQLGYSMLSSASSTPLSCPCGRVPVIVQSRTSTPGPRTQPLDPVPRGDRQQKDRRNHRLAGVRSASMSKPE